MRTVSRAVTTIGSAVALVDELCSTYSWSSREPLQRDGACTCLNFDAALGLLLVTQIAMHSSNPKSSYVDGVPRAAFDADIARFIRPNEWGSVEYVSAICNEAGDVYRIITVEGLGDYVHLAEGLKRLGLVDRLAMRLGPVGKFDAIFALDGIKVNVPSPAREL